MKYKGVGIGSSTVGSAYIHPIDGALAAPGHLHHPLHHLDGRACEPKVLDPLEVNIPHSLPFLPKLGGAVVLDLDTFLGVLKWVKCLAASL